MQVTWVSSQTIHLSPKMYLLNLLSPSSGI
jgi:hypothetical protein